MLSVVQVVFWGLVVLSLLVFIHEAGHFLAARLFHVRVTEFFLGMPCSRRLARRSKKYGTLMGVTPILFGGYTKICGMESNETESLRELFYELERQGRCTATELAITCDISEEEVYERLAALTSWASIEPYYNLEAGESPRDKDWPEAFQTVLRDGSGRTIYDVGFKADDATCMQAGAPQPLIAQNEQAFHTECKRTYVGCSFLKRLVMLLAGPFFNCVLALAIIVGLLIFAYGVSFPLALIAACKYAWTVFTYAVSLIIPTQTVEVLNQSTSVVGIAVMASTAASLGFESFLTFVASISMSLCFMNLLPIPPLDGGKVLIEFIALVRRKPVSKKTELILSYVGIAFFLFVFVYVMRLDILRFF